MTVEGILIVFVICALTELLNCKPKRHYTQRELDALRRGKGPR